MFEKDIKEEVKIKSSGEGRIIESEDYYYDEEAESYAYMAKYVYTVQEDWSDFQKKVRERNAKDGDQY